MPQQVAVEVKHQRSRILRELAAEKKTAFMRSLIGQTVSTITLSLVEHGLTETLTDNYQKLWLEGALPANQILSARVEKLGDDALLGIVQ
jgi:tRNA A37 methylthiotransferase MiaB